MKKCNILIVEDHALTRFALKTSLGEQPFVNEVYEAPDATVAYKLLGENKIHVVLMDLGLPGINGVRATQEIKKIHKSVKIIVITSHSEEAEVSKCLEAGISAYCSKDIKPDKLITLIQDVLAGSLWFDPFVSEHVLNAARATKTKGAKVSESYNLTAKEKKVLELIKVGNSNNEIAKKLNISINTTKVHVCSILQKLGVDDRTQAAIKAINGNIT
ncbi:two-component response regulator [Candidatus Gastranaerophilus sp. (ex Termes propinquus)]|nr:two-component response regulator [Candidatus Gastranaerophilus sp. (ex Termes propinquus)]